jgi:hypothetical protein
MWEFLGYKTSKKTLYMEGELVISSKPFSIIDLKFGLYMKGCYLNKNLKVRDVVTHTHYLGYIYFGSN